MTKTLTKNEIALMQESGQISALALKKVVENIKIGVTGLELDKIVTDEIKRLGGKLSFTTVDGYKWASCITINEQVVHGIPTQRKLEEGDIVSIDLGTLYQGWHTDCAWSVLLGADKEKKRFLDVGKEALRKGIKEAIDGNRIGDISEAIQNEVEGGGYSVVRSLIGHGVGRKLHEDPGIPGYGKKGTGMELKEGISLAIEVIYTKGKPEVVLDADGWTISSEDGSLGGLFEMTIIVGKKEAKVLTDWRKV